MYEHHKEPLISKRAFVRRLLFNIGIAFIILVCSLSTGIVGYHYLAGLSWLNALLNASMILSGMGPVNELTTQTGKLFASFYALFSGVMFVSVISVVIAPVLHRFLHKFHLREG